MTFFFGEKKLTNNNLTVSHVIYVRREWKFFSHSQSMCTRHDNQAIIQINCLFQTSRDAEEQKGILTYSNHLQRFCMPKEA